jgi:hypothetical protein
MFSNGLSHASYPFLCNSCLQGDKEMMKKLTNALIVTVSSAAGLFALAMAVPGSAQTSALAMLSGLNKGEWTITFRDGTPSRQICVRDGTEFIQLQHTVQTCSRFVIEDNATEVTVQYTCRGNGYGRTTIRRETGALVQIDTQGIVDGRPFDLSTEARRTGSC